MSGEFTAFFYGTLMAPEVFYNVCYGTSAPSDVIRSLHTFTPAVLHDYCRHRVRFADYPGVIAEEGQSVRGVFATGLTDANMHKLDHFEGSEYQLVRAKVKLLEKLDGKEVETGEEREAGVYVFKYPDSLERQEWDFEYFRQQKMSMWIRDEI